MKQELIQPNLTTNRKHKKDIRSALGKTVKNMLFTRVGLSAV